MTENLYDIAEKLGVRTVEDLHTPGSWEVTTNLPAQSCSHPA